MAITNEATIRVRIDGKDAEVSVKDMGKAIETAMNKGRVEAQKLKKSLSNIGDIAQKFWFTFQSFQIIGSAVKDAGELALKAKDVGNAFHAMVPPGFLEKLRENVKGTIDDFTLMQKTVEAIDLGATNEQLQVFAKFARLEALRKGGDTAIKFGEIISGVLRGSTELVDNFGINLTDLNRKIEELAGDKKLSAVERRALSVEAAVQIMNERMQELGDIAVQDSEKVAQLAATKENFRITIGKLVNNFLSLLDVGIKFFNWINNLNPKIITTTASLGVMVAIILKVRSALIAMQISAGPIGWLLGAISLTASILIPNLVKAGDEFENLTGDVDAATASLKNFQLAMDQWDEKKLTEEIKKLEYLTEAEHQKMDWTAERIEMYEKVLEADPTNKLVKQQLKEMNRLYDEAEAKLDEYVKKRNKLVDEQIAREKAKQRAVIPEMEKIGEEAGETYAHGFEKGLQKKEDKIWRNFEKQIRKIDKEYKKFQKDMTTWEREFDQKEEKLIEPVKSPFKDFIKTLEDMGSIANNTFQAIANSFQMLSDRMVQALFNTKTKFKDIWRMMAMDFTRIFVNYVLGELAKIAAMKFASAVGLNLLAPGAGSIISAATIAPGFTATGGNNNALLREVSGLRSDINKLSTSVVVNNRIGSTQLYEGIKYGRERDLIRRGKEINNELF